MLKGKKGKKEEKEGEDKQSEGKARRVKRGLRALKERKKYQSGSELLINETAIPEGSEGDSTGIKGDLCLKSTAMMALQEVGETFWWAFWNN